MELRKRKAPEPAAAPVKKAAKEAKPKAEPKAKAEKTKAEKPEKAEKKTEKAEKPAEKETKETKKAPAKKQVSSAAPSPFPEVGSTIDLATFGGEVETNDAEKTTLKDLVEASKAGVVLFTYPKASTPGCTKQACLFRDEYTPLTASGLAIYGLSNDSPKANTTFKTNQKLPYPLLCDPAQTLIDAIGLRKAAGGGATRGVFVVDKSGKVLVAEAGSPDGTVATVQKIVADL